MLYVDIRGNSFGLSVNFLKSNTVPCIWGSRRTECICTQRAIQYGTQWLGFMEHDWGMVATFLRDDFFFHVNHLSCYFVVLLYVLMCCNVSLLAEILRSNVLSF